MNTRPKTQTKTLRLPFMFHELQVSGALISPSCGRTALQQQCLGEYIDRQSSDCTHACLGGGGVIYVLFCIVFQIKHCCSLHISKHMTVKYALPLGAAICPQCMWRRVCLGASPLTVSLISSVKLNSGCLARRWALI